MNLGIIGAGVIVQDFLPRLVKLDGLKVVAIQGVIGAKAQVEELCRANGVEHAVFSFEELAALDIDTVYVAVPNFLHFMYCKQALEVGLNVIVEKPITSNSDEAHELKRLAEQNHRFLFEAVTTVYFDGFQIIKQWLPRIGTVKIVHCNYSKYSRRYDQFRAGEILPAFDPAKSGGALMDLNLYNLHFAMGLFGRPEDAVYYANVERGIDTSGTLILRYPGFVASCIASKDCAAPYSFVIQGTEGYITTQYSPNLIGEVTLHLNDKTEEHYDDGMAMNRLIPEFRYFIDCIDYHSRRTLFDEYGNSHSAIDPEIKQRIRTKIIDKIIHDFDPFCLPEGEVLDE